jgi:polar amino acid transport system substrate-binding protein
MQATTTGRRHWAALVAGFAFAGAGIGQATAQDAPAAGVSTRVDAIKKAGILRVGVLANLPWLAENTSGAGEAWSGPAWTLSKEYAKLLGVKLQPVLVSHETKVPVLASNQVDLSITALAETPERLKVVDFVLYSRTSVCLFGLEANPKIAAAKSVDDLNNPEVTIAYFVGSAEENWVKERFPKAKFRAVTGSGTAPVEEIMGKRADASPINRVPFPAMQKKVKGLAALPRENNCQGSTEKAQPVGLAIDKGQGPFLDWLRAVAKRMQADLDKDEQGIIEKM